MDAQWTRRAGHPLAMALLLVGVLHAYWALGGRWGRAAVPGVGNPVPPEAAVWAVVIGHVIAALIVLGKIGVRGRFLPAWPFARGSWALCAAFAAVALLNLGSGRPWEMLLIAPLSLLLALLAAAVARARCAGTRSSRDRSRRDGDGDLSAASLRPGRLPSGSTGRPSRCCPRAPCWPPPDARAAGCGRPWT